MTNEDNSNKIEDIILASINCFVQINEELRILSNMCRRNQNNEHMPKINPFKQFIFEKDKLNIGSYISWVKEK